MSSEASTSSFLQPADQTAWHAVAADPPFAPQVSAFRPWMRFCVLGSGSAGNASLVQIGQNPADSPGSPVRSVGTLLIDLGFGPATLQRRLERVGLTLADIQAVCLTHLDWDHFRDPWLELLPQQNISLWIHRGHRTTFQARPGAGDFQSGGWLRCFEHQPFWPLGQDVLCVEPVLLPHDQEGAVGFVIRWHSLRLGYATDLGHVPDRLTQAMQDVDILAIEANYDPEMEQASDRPAFVKARVMGGRGHLSNQQAFEAVRTILRHSQEGRPRYIVLLHCSRQCNHPQLLRQLFSQDPAVARRLVLTSQGRHSPWLEVRGPATRRWPLKT